TSAARGHALPFQYPLSDRSWWDAQRRIALAQQQPMLPFQYPLSDRSWWDEKDVDLARFVAVFQYPLSDRSWWDTDERNTELRFQLEVSVSSIGSILVGPPSSVVNFPGRTSFFAAT
ncbi:MAG: hypothetical protein KDH86_11465, partial [Anaerolineae bacterium]|nr:hypothetical protein [Anaerolineae bacterium]